MIKYSWKSEFGDIEDRIMIKLNDHLLKYMREKGYKNLELETIFCHT